MTWYGLNRSGSEQRPVEGPCEHGNEPSGSIKCWDLFEWLNNWLLLKKGSAPRSQLTSLTLLGSNDKAILKYDKMTVVLDNTS
jgi:hypothetical protein